MPKEIELLEYLKHISPVYLALLATIFTWSVTAAGAALIFLFKTFNRKLLDGMLGFASGIMIAASFWSLLHPAVAMAEEYNTLPPWLIVSIGFLAGGLAIYLTDKILPHQHPFGKTEGISTGWHRSILLVLAITLHNIPEGLAVGISYGALAINYTDNALLDAIALTIGMGIQNFPEGMAVAAPLRREGYSPWKCFFYGQLSAVVEPIAGVSGAYLVLLISPVLPYALSFAAGAMIYVVIEELIPEAKNNRNSDLATICAMLGFALMMMLDIGLG